VEVLATLFLVSLVLGVVAGLCAEYGSALR